MSSSPAENSVSVQIEQHKTQRDEYQKFTVAKMVGPIERVLRDLYNAAILTANAKGTKDSAGIFRKIAKRIPEWTDDEVSKEFPGDTADIDACIRMAVRAHATVIALSCNKGCRKVIKVPSAQVFFRKVLAEIAMDHDPELFGTKKLSQRSKLRYWIEECVIRHLIGIVPISLFATEDDEEAEPVAYASAPPQKRIEMLEASCPIDPEPQKIEAPVPTAAEIVDAAEAAPTMPKVPSTPKEEPKREEIVRPLTPEVRRTPTPKKEIAEETEALTESSPDFGSEPQSPAALPKKEVVEDDEDDEEEEEEEDMV